MGREWLCVCSKAHKKKKDSNPGKREKGAWGFARGLFSGQMGNGYLLFCGLILFFRSKCVATGMQILDSSVAMHAFTRSCLNMSRI